MKELNFRTRIGNMIHVVSDGEIIPVAKHVYTDKGIDVLVNEMGFKLPKAHFRKANENIRSYLKSYNQKKIDKGDYTDLIDVITYNYSYYNPDNVAQRKVHDLIKFYSETLLFYTNQNVHSPSTGLRLYIQFSIEYGEPRLELNEDDIFEIKEIFASTIADEINTGIVGCNCKIIDDNFIRFNVEYPDVQRPRPFFMDVEKIYGKDIYERIEKLMKSFIHSIGFNYKFYDLSSYLSFRGLIYKN